MLPAVLASLALLPGAHAAAAMPQLCVTTRARRRNGDMVVSRAHTRGLWLASPTGRVIRRLTPPSFPGPHDLSLSFSPDHRRIAYAHLAAHAQWQIWIYDIARGRGHRVHGGGRHEQVDEVRWSPDGRRLAFQRTRHLPNHPEMDVAVVRPNGRGLRSLYPEASQPNYPSPLAWSPNGKCIAFQVGDLYDSGVAVAPSNRASGEAGFVWRTNVALPDGQTAQGPAEAVFAPDGRRIYVTDETSPGYSNRIDSASVLQPGPESIKTPLHVEGVSPVPSPDGRKLAFTRQRAFIAPTAGGRARALPGIRTVYEWWAAR
jgi:dipeptidyl aminopeptidase/acylaminoacyl peptidase